MMSRSDFLAKHAARIERDTLYGCYLWTGPLDRDGYGVSYSGGRGPRAAHLVAYRELVGEPPAGKVLDHLCRRRNCVRPEHLEPITGAENDRRRSWRYRARMKTCPRGHSLATSILTPESGRVCRVCSGPEPTE